MAPAPAVTGVSPTHGPLAGGNTITVTGTNLSGVTAVTIGGNPATIVGSPTSTTLTVTAPSSTAVGATTLLVTAPGGTDTGTYTYDPLPALTGLTPSSGTSQGGTTVTLTGSNFTGATSVRFGATSGTALSVVNDSTITVHSPAHTAGLVDVTMVGPSGTSPVNSADGFTFIADSSAPTVTGAT